MIVDRVLTKDGATAFPGSLVGLRFPRNKLQAYFVADGNPSDTLPINVNITHKLESYVTPRVSLFFNLGPVTAGLTEGVSRVRGQSYATLGNFGEAALRMRVEFNGSNGVLLETGAGIGTTARGAAIYAWQGIQYHLGHVSIGTTARGAAIYAWHLDYGRSNTVNQSGVELSFPAPIGTRLLEVKIQNTGASMFIDGVRVAFHTVSLTTAKSGSDVGGVGAVVGNGIRATRAGWGIGQGTYSGAITDIVVFRNPAAGLIEPAVEPEE